MYTNMKNTKGSKIMVQKAVLVILALLLFVYPSCSHAIAISNTTILTDNTGGLADTHQSNTVSAVILTPIFWDPLTKTVSPAGNLSPGSVVTYTNTFGNAGNATATGGFMIDNLDANLINIQVVPGVNTLVAGSPAAQVTGTATFQHVVAGPFDNNPAAPVIAVRWDFSPIPSGFVGTVSFTANIAPTAPEGVNVPNSITLSGASTTPVTSNVVITPVSSNLAITKAADKKSATVGDAINYNVTVKNTNATLTVASTTVTDYLPMGMRYVKGSAVIINASGANVPLADPAISADGQILVFSGIGTLTAQTSATIKYSAIVGAPSALLDVLDNKAVANATLPSGFVIGSNIANAKTTLDQGLMGAESIIIGKVFIDDNDNKVQDNGELGVPKIKVFLEDGTYTYTDFEGKYHFEGIKQGLHTVRIDPRSLYTDMELLTVSNQNADNPGSTFVDVKNSGLYKANFRVKGNKMATNVAFKMKFYMTAKKETLVTREFHLADRIYFDPGKGELRADSLKVLNEYLAVLKQYKDRIISIDLQVEGHTDNQQMGQNTKKLYANDEDLGLARAQAVKDYLIKNFGLSEENFSTLDGYGDYMPIADNKTLKSKQENRRAEVHAYFTVQDKVNSTVMKATDNNIVNLNAQLDYKLAFKDMYIVAVGGNTVNIAPGSTITNGKKILYASYYPEQGAYVWKIDGLNEMTNSLDMSIVLRHNMSATEFSGTVRLYLAGKSKTRSDFYILQSLNVDDEQQEAQDRNQINKLLSVENPKINEMIQANSSISRSYLDDLYSKLDDKDYLENLDDKFEILYPNTNISQSVPATRVIVKYPSRFNLSVKSNGKDVPASAIGRKINSPKKGFNIYEFVGVSLDTGKNDISVQLGDNFGNIRGSASATVTVVGALDHVAVDTKDKEFPADGRTEPEIAFNVYDQNNNPAMDGMVTVTITDGQKILTPDANPSSEGHQISYTNGKGIIKFAPSNKTGEFKINFYIDRYKETYTEKLAFVPVGQNWFINGQAQLSTQGATTFTPKANNAQTQVYAKGTAFDDYLVTMRIDTNKTINKQKLYGQISPDKLYPVYGDSSVQGYDAQSQGPIFARIEKSNMYLQYGDYNTGFSDNLLTAYNRSFSGVKGYYKTNGLKSYMYQSTTSQSQVRNILPANGTSGPYFMQFNSIVENSETIKIESRDRFRPEIIVQTVTLTRYDDYNIDYVNGRILFNKPVSVTDNTFNPQSIIVTYETNGGNATFNNIGGRLAYDLDQNGASNIGVTAVSEEKASGTSTMYGADTSLVYGTTRLKAEYGTVNLVDLVGNASSSKAYRLDLSTRLGTNLTAAIEHQNIGVGYSNLSISAPDVGTIKTGGNITYSFDSDLRIGAKGYTNDMISSNLNRTVLGAFAEKKYGIFNFGLGYDSVSETNKAANTTIGSQLAKANVSATYGQLTGKVSREQVLNNTITAAYPNRTQLGIDYRIHEFITANISHEIADTASTSQALTHMGLSSRFKLSDTLTSYADYGIDTSIDGPRAVAKVGLRDQIQITDKLSGSLTLDRGQVLSGTPVSAVGTNNATGDYTAYGVSGQYLEDTYKVSGKVEQRIAQGSNTSLFNLGYATLFTQDMSVLLSETYSSGDTGVSTVSANNLSLGIAYRPIGWDSFNSLLKISSINSIDTLNGSYDRLLAIADMNYQPYSRLTLQGRFGVANNTNPLANGTKMNTTTSLIGGRFNYEFTDSMDGGLHLNVLSQAESATTLKSYGVHAGYKLMRDFWVELGYNVDGYDDGVFKNTNTQQGAYLDMRMKFDEATFGLQNKNRVFSVDTQPLKLSYNMSPAGTRIFGANTQGMNLSYNAINKNNSRVFVANTNTVAVNYNAKPAALYVVSVNPPALQYSPSLSSQSIGNEIRKDAFKLFMAKQAMMFNAGTNSTNISYN